MLILLRLDNFVDTSSQAECALCGRVTAEPILKNGVNRSPILSMILCIFFTRELKKHDFPNYYFQNIKCPVQKVQNGPGRVL